jgi:hypothetical protein
LEAHVLHHFTDVDEDCLETVVPEVDGVVRLVRGDQIGELAKVLRKDRSSGRVLVETANDMEVLELGMDDVCASR